MKKLENMIENICMVICGIPVVIAEKYLVAMFGIATVMLTPILVAIWAFMGIGTTILITKILNKRG